MPDKNPPARYGDPEPDLIQALEAGAKFLTVPDNSIDPPRLMILGGVNLTVQAMNLTAKEIERFAKDKDFLLFPGDYRVAQLLGGAWVEIFPVIGEEPDAPKRVRFLSPVENES
jgi:hypothetical protein